ncbi:MAG: hypothetical protein PHI12_07580 [Dehalococcoidales bacterium]|nr:hypothetical protein [Dehalococcoidales bacterium]
MPEATDSTNSVERRTEPLTLSGKGIGRGRVVTPPGRAKNVALVPRRGIPVGQKYRIASIPYNIVIQKRHTTLMGREHWETIGYYLTLSSAIRGIIQEDIKETDLVDLKAIQDRITQLEQDILKLAAGK